MMDFGAGFVPASGFSAAWLKSLYYAKVARSRAVGKDGIRPSMFAAALDAECELISSKVNEGSYRFTNYREKLIARGAKRPPRQISIPTIRDRLALRGALEFLKAHFPESQPRPPHLYIKEIKGYLGSARQHSSFLRMDIQDFYPSLRHDLLAVALRQSKMPDSVINLIMSAVSTRTGGHGQKCPDKGVPQGLSISNALASIYMVEFDKIASSEIFYRRYVDDVLVIDHSERIFKTYQALWAGLNNIGLSSHPMGSPDKTETKTLAEGVQYLGYEVTPNGVSVRASSVARMFSNIAKVLTCFKYKKTQDKHLFRLNLKISGCIINNARRGWLMFFSQTDNVSQLAYLDSWLEKAISPFEIDRNLVKKFKKAYYEIKYNLLASDYIPNFDKYDINQKKEVIAILTGRSAEVIGAMDVVAIDYEFNRLIGKEVSELERDLADAFS